MGIKFPLAHWNPCERNLMHCIRSVDTSANKQMLFHRFTPGCYLVQETLPISEWPHLNCLSWTHRMRTFSFRSAKSWDAECLSCGQILSCMICWSGVCFYIAKARNSATYLSVIDSAFLPCHRQKRGSCLAGLVIVFLKPTLDLQMEPLIPQRDKYLVWWSMWWVPLRLGKPPHAAQGKLWYWGQIRTWLLLYFDHEQQGNNLLLGGSIHSIASELWFLSYLLSRASQALCCEFHENIVHGSETTTRLHNSLYISHVCRCFSSERLAWCVTRRCTHKHRHNTTLSRVKIDG